MFEKVFMQWVLIMEDFMVFFEKLDWHNVKLVTVFLHRVAKQVHVHTQSHSIISD